MRPDPLPLLVEFIYRHYRTVLVAAIAGLAFGWVPGLFSQATKFGKFQRELSQIMAKNVWDDVRKNYYDPNFKGVDMEARFKEANEKIEQAQSFNQVFIDIQWALDGLHDSHTHFMSPPRLTRSEYGWQMQMYGSWCYVSAVKPGTDAAKKIHAGDRILTIDGYAATRDTLPELRGLFESLVPQTSLKVSEVTADGKRGNEEVQAQVQERVRNMNVWGENVTDLYRMEYQWELEHESKWYMYKDELMVWRMPTFFDEMDKELNEANKHKALILDLRGNPGGPLALLDRVAGGFFDHDLDLAQTKGRKPGTQFKVKSRGGKAFTGKLIILVDSETGSAAELLARSVQLQKRGTVIGDRTAGAVMVSEAYTHKSSPDNTQIVLYGAAVSIFDVIMPDGGRLEGVGVTPDEMMVPTQADLAAGKDPVLAHAMELAGVKVSPEQAGKLFEPIWEEPSKGDNR
jgi:carboxyl-terminal processing protease